MMQTEGQPDAPKLDLNGSRPSPSMTRDELRNACLASVYEGWCVRGKKPYLSVADMEASTGASRKAVFEAFSDLVDEGFVKWDGQDLIEIQALGIITSEGRGLAAPVLKLNKALRWALMEALQEAEELPDEERVGYVDPYDLPGRDDYEQDEEGPKVDQRANLEHLAVGGCIRDVGGEGYKITALGTENVQRLRQRRSWTTRLAALESLMGVTPQQRGHELEKLIEEILTAQGWDCERNIVALGEEHDLVIRRGSQYYFVPCRWREADGPAGDDWIREIVGTLSDRPGVPGAIVSMTGFTEPARTKAVHRAMLLLLFGPGDICDLVHGRKTFDELLIEKTDSVVKRRKTLVDGVTD